MIFIGMDCYETNTYFNLFHFIDSYMSWTCSYSNKEITLLSYVSIEMDTLSLVFVIKNYFLQACLVTLQLPEQVCSNLTGKNEIEVEKVANKLVIYSQVIQTIPSMIFVLLVGSWSDKHGRKTPLIAAVVGKCINCVLLMVS